jgi:hypothetical protein
MELSPRPACVLFDGGGTPHATAFSGMAALAGLAGQ